MRSKVLGSCIFESGKPKELFDELHIVAARSFETAYKDYLSKNWFSRTLLKQAKPKYLRTISKLYLKFVVLPYDSKSIIYDTLAKPMPLFVFEANFDPVQLLCKNIDPQIKDLPDEGDYIKMIAKICSSLDLLQEEKCDLGFVRGDSLLANEINDIARSAPDAIPSSAIAPTDIHGDPLTWVAKFQKFMETKERMLQNIGDIRSQIESSEGKVQSLMNEIYTIEINSGKIEYVRPSITHSYLFSAIGDSLFPLRDLVTGNLHTEIEPRLANIEKEHELKSRENEAKVNTRRRDAEREFEIKMREVQADFNVRVGRIERDLTNARKKLEEAENAYHRYKSLYEDAVREYNNARSRSQPNYAVISRLEVNVTEYQSKMEYHSERQDEFAQYVADLEKEKKATEKERKETITNLQNELTNSIRDIDDEVQDEYELLEQKKQFSIELETRHIEKVKQDFEDTVKIAEGALEQCRFKVEEFQTSIELPNYWSDDNKLLQLKQESIRIINRNSFDKLHEIKDQITKSAININAHILSISCQEPYELSLPFWFIEMESSEALDCYVVSSSSLVIAPVSSKERLTRIDFTPLYSEIDKLCQIYSKTKDVVEAGRTSNVLTSLRIDQLGKEGAFVKSGLVTKELANAVDKFLTSIQISGGRAK